MRIESIVAPEGLAMSYLRAPAQTWPQSRAMPFDDRPCTTTRCLFPGGCRAEASLVEDALGIALFVSLDHRGTVHEVLIAARPETSPAALWAALALVAPVDGWRLPSHELMAVHELLAGNVPAGNDTRSVVLRWLGDAALVAAIRSTLERTVTLEWTERLVETAWLVSGDVRESTSTVTVTSRVDEQHCDLWTTTLDVLAACVAQRLERCAGTVEIFDRTWTSSDSISDLLEALTGALAG